MHDLSDFQHNVTELMQHLGFDMAPPGAEQDMVSLTIDQRFEIHVGSLDSEYWFMVAMVGHYPDHLSLFSQALQGNQPAAQTWQPVAALDADNQLCCWLRLPVRGHGLPDWVMALDALVSRAEQLLEEANTSSTQPSPSSPSTHWAKRPVIHALAGRTVAKP